MLAHKTSIFFFLEAFIEYLITLEGSRPVSAILPAKTDIIDFEFLSSAFIVSLTCFFVNIAVIFKLIPSFDKSEMIVFVLLPLNL